mgnify:CR=1 FL=1
MSENVLKKEFKEKDIQRLRNLIQGKHGEKATMGTGYTKKQEFHEEGDVWGLSDKALALALDKYTKQLSLDKQHTDKEIEQIIKDGMHLDRYLIEDLDEDY